MIQRISGKWVYNAVAVFINLSKYLGNMLRRILMIQGWARVFQVKGVHRLRGILMVRGGSGVFGSG